MTPLSAVPHEQVRSVPSGAPVGVVGAGTMGAGIALLAAQAGHPVRLLDARPDAVAAAVEAVSARLRRLVTKGVVDDDAARTTSARLSAVASVAELAGCAVVVEAIAEILAAKQQLFAELEGVLDGTALLATNTSSLSVTAVANGLQHPERVVGLHFFNPADRMKLVEVVRGEQTAPSALAAAERLARAWGKTPVQCSSTPGFVVNRVARPFYGEAQRLLELRAADAATVDAVLRDCAGFRLGPFELTDLVGQDVNLAVSRSVWDQTFHDPRYAPTVLQQRLVDAGRFGRKTGHGVYAYDDEGAALDPGTGRTPAADEVHERHLAPRRVRYFGGWNVLLPLLHRVKGVQVVDLTGSGHGTGLERDEEYEDDGCATSPGLVLPSGGLLVETPTEGQLHLGDDAVVADWLLEPDTATRVCLAPLPGATLQTINEAVGFMQAMGMTVTLVRPVAGLVVARTVSMLVNEATDLVARGEASPEDVDTAMRLGTGYPLGPLEWGDHVGPLCVLGVLRALHDSEPTGRYRPSPRLVEAGETGAPLRGRRS
ncbi:MAG TPA: 3-hydroxyacyl-CoA dehydrogenase [Actinomycetales bacterium]|nr:3-hydroxyacyl-CoA dehydrogenase [Actinomycetales bacterium]